MKRKLPKHVTAFRDRHGKERFRYRKGGISRYLRGPLNSPEFREDLKAARNADPAPLAALSVALKSTAAQSPLRPRAIMRLKRKQRTTRHLKSRRPATGR